MEVAGRRLVVVVWVHVGGELEMGDRGACIVMAEQVEIARGLINYSAIESRQIIGRASHDIESILGYVDEPELIHRDNLVVL